MFDIAKWICDWQKYVPIDEHLVSMVRLPTLNKYSTEEMCGPYKILTCPDDKTIDSTTGETTRRTKHYKTKHYENVYLASNCFN